MDTKPIVKVTLALPPLFKEIIESDRELRAVMKEKVVPFNLTTDYIRRAKRLRRAAEKIYYPSKEDKG